MPGIDPAASPAVGFLFPEPEPTRLPPSTAQELDLREGSSGAAWTTRAHGLRLADAVAPGTLGVTTFGA